MTTFAERLKSAMDQAHVTQADLSVRTGICPAGISQYLSGKHKPTKTNICGLAEALGVPMDYLMGYDVPIEPALPVGFPAKVTVVQAALCMGKGEQFIREGLKRAILPFGSAVRLSSVWTYYISPAKFREYVGATHFDRFFGCANPA